MKPTKTLSSYVLTVGLMFLMMAGSFVVYQVYSALVKSQISKEQQIAIRPLDGTINDDDLNNLVGREVFGAFKLSQPLAIRVQEEVEEKIDLEPEATATIEATQAGKVEE